MIRIEDICEKVRRNHPQADLNLLRRAYLFSAREHKGQKRASGESYLVHPLEVANILADMRMDAVSVSTGLLHDVVEDSPVTIPQIRKWFGPVIADAVDAQTRRRGESYMDFIEPNRPLGEVCEDSCDEALFQACSMASCRREVLRTTNRNRADQFCLHSVYIDQPYLERL